MEKKNYIMGRTEILTKQEMVKRGKHNYRSYKRTPSIKNDNENFQIKDGQFIPFSTLSRDKKTIHARFTKLYEDNKKEHRKLHIQKKGYYLNSNQTQSTVEGVVALSQFNTDIFDELELQEITCQIENNLKSFANDLGTELQDLVLHLDERNYKTGKGEFHFHFFMKNFNQQAESLQLGRRSKNTKKLQDYLAKDMEKWGIVRGEEGSTRKHKTIREYQELQEDLQILREDKEDLKSEKENLISEINNIISNIINIDPKGNYKNKINKLTDNLQKYLKSDNLEGLEKLLERSEKLENSANKQTKKMEIKP